MPFLMQLLQTCKPDFVSRCLIGMVIIYLAVTLLQRSCCLPFSVFALGRAALKRWYTWHCSTQGLPQNTVTCTLREHLPHVFTLTVFAYGGNFLWHYLPVVKQARLLTGVLLCAVRTFLIVLRCDGPVCSSAKVGFLFPACRWAIVLSTAITYA